MDNTNVSKKLPEDFRKRFVAILNSLPARDKEILLDSLDEVTGGDREQEKY